MVSAPVSGDSESVVISSNNDSSFSEDKTSIWEYISRMIEVWSVFKFIFVNVIKHNQNLYKIMLNDIYRILKKIKLEEKKFYI